MYISLSEGMSWQYRISSDMAQEMAESKVNHKGKKKKTIKLCWEVIPVLVDTHYVFKNKSSKEINHLGIMLVWFSFGNEFTL